MRRRWAVVLGTLGGMTALTAAAAAALPGYVAQRCVRAAGKAGVTLAIGGAHVSLDGVTLEDLVALAPEVPGVRLAVKRVALSPLPWSPSAATLAEVDVTVDGPLDRVEHDLEAFAAKHQPPPESASIERAEIASAHVVWTHPLGGVERVDARGTGSWARDGARMVASADTVHVSTSRGADFGPWAATIALGSASSQATAWLDAARAAKVTWSASASSAQLIVDVPRTPIGGLGVPAAALGALTTSATSVEASIDLSGSSRAALHGHAFLAGYDVRVPMLASPTGVRAKGEVTASLPGKFVFEHGELGVPPLLGSMSGEGVIDAQGGVHAQLVIDAAVPCADAAEIEARSVLGGRVAPEIARAGVSGDIAVRATIHYDADHHPALAVAAQPTPHCTATPARLFDTAVAAVRSKIEHDWLGGP